MVIEELAHELDQEHAELGALRQLDAMLARRKRLEFELDRLRRLTPAEATERVEQLSSELADLKTRIRLRDQEIEGRFNRYWGKLFKCGEITSHFGSQVKDFACVYTSAVRNFLDYPEDMYFRSPREIMPHEMGLERWQGF
jgi:regulator of replication initiation timing